MTDYSIDALSTAENLKASGFSESQAEAITVTAREATATEPGCFNNKM